jgi:ankyrin repeat protein
MGESDYSLHLLNRVAADGNIDLFDHLVTRGADASLSTALHSASKCEDHEMSRAMVRRLLDKYHMDINRNNEDFRDFFRDADDKGSPLCSAILHRNLTVVHELLQRGASPIEPDKYPISYAVMLDGFLPALKPLFSAGADPTVALKQASSFRNFEAARMCLDNGADPVPALQNALERYERKTKSIAEDKAGNASSSVPHHEEYQGMSARTKAEMRDRKAMIEWLRRAAESHLASDIAGS